MGQTDPITENVVEPVTEPVREAVGTVERSTNDLIRDLAETVNLHGTRIDGLSSSLNQGLNDVLGAINRIPQTAATVAQEAVSGVADVASAATEVPEAATETVAATVETAADPPKIRKKRLVGRSR